ncbi:hypothetical protein HNR23_004396 [Nocardiopsis mwathae]|uniref:Uncharacterized protein n=1 Tax=Nocardiopsis mwathae TaxID=1472723 RepID=A0A7X0D825_9ACTN|nr:hypothetical protein [Nocardiopsis mwathae]MBB6174336.1 hypothetical protein [Nocardiopsis mwathae]
MKFEMIDPPDWDDESPVAEEDEAAPAPVRPAAAALTPVTLPDPKANGHLKAVADEMAAQARGVITPLSETLRRLELRVMEEVQAESGAPLPDAGADPSLVLRPEKFRRAGGAAPTQADREDAARTGEGGESA